MPSASRARLIYGLVDPTTEQCRYVGRSSSGLARARNHHQPARLRKDRTYKGNWIRKLAEDGFLPRAVVLEEVPDGDLNLREIAWIEYGKQLGWPLTNLTKGGMGLSGYRLTEEHRAKIAAAHLGKKGSPLSPEHREALLSSRRGVSMSTEHREKIRAALVGKKRNLSREARRKMSRGRPVRNQATGEVYPSVKKAAQAVGLSDRSVTRILRGRISSAKGYVFRYADESSTPPTVVAFFSA